MAFDEDFHLGIIRIYAHHISPYWGTQPPGSEAFGAITRDPAFLYHWIMSFPYRIVNYFTDDQTLLVLVLRFLNILLFVSCLPLFRRLLEKTGAPRAIIHFCLLFFVLIPVVPLLAAQINYDNMMIPLTALSLLLTVQFTERFKPGRPIDIRLLLTLIITCLVTSLVKYSFLPIFVVIVIYIMVRALQCLGGFGSLWLAFKKGFVRISRRSFVALGLTFIVIMTLFIQRYGVNLIKYHKPVPDCSQVLTIKQCSNYGPWIRDYTNKQIKDNDNIATSAIDYIGDWFYGMWFRSYFAVDGPATQFQTRGPLLIPSISVIIFSVGGVIALIFTVRRIFKAYNAPVLWFFISATLIYLAALFIDDYVAYVHTAVPVAINGRYLFPVLPIVLLIFALAYNELLRKRHTLKVVLACVIIIATIWGGGALTYILRSNDAWYWNAQPVYDINHAVQHVVGPITPGYTSPTEFLRSQ